MVEFNMHLAPPDLFQESPIEGIALMSLPIPYSPLMAHTESRLPIGKQIEETVLAYFNKSERYEVLTYGLQIQDKGITVGELDFIVRDFEDDTVFHLELVHKFYIYDEREGETMIERLVGPNRKDRLIYKLKKLKDQQFPLLYHPLTRPHLEMMQIIAEDIEQRLCFRGELFFTEDQHQIDRSMTTVNPLCHTGTYCRFVDFLSSTEVKGTLYHLCTKSEWIMDMYDCQEWVGKEEILQQLESRQQDARAVMVWVKEEGRINRQFLLFE